MSTSGIALKPIDDPWLAFLRAVDRQLQQPTEIHCIGGFALLLFLERPRPTGDIDFVDAVPDRAATALIEIAGRDTALAVEHKLYLQEVRISERPCDYQSRLLDATPVGFGRLGVKILDPYDLVLTKIQRNSPRDRQDAGFLVSELGLNGGTLHERFEEELKPYLAVAADRTVRTFELWMEEFFSSGSG